jgi:hypothetical protein
MLATAALFRQSMLSSGPLQPAVLGLTSSLALQPGPQLLGPLLLPSRAAMLPALVLAVLAQQLQALWAMASLTLLVLVLLPVALELAQPAVLRLVLLAVSLAVVLQLAQLVPPWADALLPLAAGRAVPHWTPESCPCLPMRAVD